MKIGILGSGVVGTTLAEGLKGLDHETMIGSGHPEKLADFKAKTGIPTGSFEAAGQFGEVLILAVKGVAAVKIVKEMAPILEGKTVLDATNPIEEVAPEDGVLRFFTDMNHSLLEQLQEAVPEAHFVKALNSVGSAAMVKPAFKEKPSMFIAGNDEGSKKVATDLLKSMGWEIEDMGTAKAARAIEPLCMLWCIPGFLKNDWVHAFKLLR